MQLNDPGTIVFGAILNSAGLHGAGPQDSAGDHRQPGQGAADARKTSTARARGCSPTSICSFAIPSQIGLTMSEWVSKGDWRLLFLNRDRLRASHAGRRAARRQGVSEDVELTVAEFIPDANPDRATIPPKARCRGHAEGLQGRCGDGRGRGVRSVAGEHRVARPAHARSPSGMKVSLLPKQTRGNIVSATIRLHFGTLDRLNGQDAVGGAGHADADARHAEEEPPADPGRVRPPEGARQRRRRRHDAPPRRSKPCGRICRRCCGWWPRFCASRRFRNRSSSRSRSCC